MGWLIFFLQKKKTISDGNGMGQNLLGNKKLI
jgi:hypothetical protein